VRDTKAFRGVKYATNNHEENAKKFHKQFAVQVSRGQSNTPIMFKQVRDVKMTY